MNGEPDDHVGQILAFISELAPTAQCQPGDDLLDTVGLSSVQVLDLVEKIEDHFDIAFPLNDLADLRTVEDLANHLSTLVQS